MREPERRSLRLASQGFDLDSFMIDLLTEQIAGFVRPESTTSFTSRIGFPSMTTSSA